MVRVGFFFLEFVWSQGNGQGNADFIALLDYLEQCQCITQQESSGLKSEIVSVDGLYLTRLIALFADMNWAQEFLLSLPADLGGTPNSADPQFANLIATDFSSSLYVTLKDFLSQANVKPI